MWCDGGACHLGKHHEILAEELKIYILKYFLVLKADLRFFSFNNCIGPALLLKELGLYEIPPKSHLKLSVLEQLLIQ